VIDNWTSEELALMTKKLAERKQREADAIRGKPTNKVSDTQLFRNLGDKIKVVKSKPGG